MDNIGTIKLRCSCGSDQFSYPEDLKIPEDPANPATVKCLACGLESTLPTRDAQVRFAEKAIADALGKALKGR